MNNFLYRSLEQQLSEEIEQGRWQPGDRLPSIRTLVQEQGLSKTTVMHALNRLEARGLIESRPKAGFFVRPQYKPIPVNEPSRNIISSPAPVPVSVNAVTQELMCRSAAFDISPDAGTREALPPGLLQLNRTVARELRRQKGLHQYYDEPAGSQQLRDILARRYKRQGCQVDACDLTITTGCQQALFFALMCLCQRGDLVAVESPGFYGVLQLLEGLGLKAIEIPCDPVQGMDLDVLAQAAEKWPIKACVVTPSFATPTGALMPLENRKQLLVLAEQYDFHIVEDDIYRELAFDHPMPPLQALDRQGRVILCGSISKTLSRDLRVGWVISERWREEIQRLKLVTSLATSRYVQQGVASFIEDGGYDRHLRRYIPNLQAQRDELITTIQYEWPMPCASSVPQGGLTLWVELPQHIDSMQVYARAREQDILITPGALFTAADHFRNCIRISYTHPWNPDRKAALNVLGSILAEINEQ